MSECLPQHPVLASSGHMFVHNVDVHVVDGRLAGDVGRAVELETGSLAVGRGGGGGKTVTALCTYILYRHSLFTFLRFINAIQERQMQCDSIPYIVYMYIVPYTMINVRNTCTLTDLL